MCISSSRIIAINTVAAYVRIAFCGVLALLSSRWLLHAMGEIDYGLYFVIWGAVGMMAFFSAAMAMSAQRHFAYAIGKGDVDSVNNWFNASLMVHFVLGVLLVALGMTIGHWLINSVLVIPDERVAVSYKVFLCLLVTVFVRVISIPCLGFLTAKQRIYEVAAWQILQASLLCVYAYFLMRLNRDRLLAYSEWVTAVTVAIAAAQFVRCALGFKECIPRMRFKRALCSDLLSFGGWNLFGTLAGIGSRQGMAFVVNIFSGAAVNTSLGLSYQVGDAGESVAMGVSHAMLPEITSSEGRGDRDRVISLALLSSKLAVLSFGALLIPLVGEIRTVLGLWLTAVPEHMASLCCIVLVALFFDKLTIGYMAALFAKGKIAGYQATVGSIGLMTPVIGFALYRQGVGVEWSAGCALLVPRVINVFSRLYWTKRLLGVPVRRWVYSVLFRCAASLTLSVILMVIMSIAFSASPIRLVSSFVLCGFTLAGCTWMFGLNAEEKFFLKQKFARLIAALPLKV